MSLNTAVWNTVFNNSSDENRGIFYLSLHVLTLFKGIFSFHQPEMDTMVYTNHKQDNITLFCWITS